VRPWRAGDGLDFEESLRTCAETGPECNDLSAAWRAVLHAIVNRYWKFANHRDCVIIETSDGVAFVQANSCGVKIEKLGHNLDTISWGRLRTNECEVVGCNANSFGVACLLYTPGSGKVLLCWRSWGDCHWNRIETEARFDYYLDHCLVAADGTLHVQQYWPGAGSPDQDWVGNWQVTRDGEFVPVLNGADNITLDEASEQYECPQFVELEISKGVSARWYGTGQYVSIIPDDYNGPNAGFWILSSVEGWEPQLVECGYWGGME
jgi:hypothetical protein